MNYSTEKSLQDILRSTLTDGGHCLTIERIAELAAGGAPADQETGHLKGCLRCSAELEVARSFHAPLEEGDAEEVEQIAKALEAKHLARQSAKVVPLTGRPQRPPATWNRGWALAAMVLMTAGTVTWQMQSSPPALPDRPTVDVARGSVLELDLPDPADLESWSRVSWPAYPGATVYQVQVQRIDGEPVWSSKTPNTEASLPGELQQGVSPGVTLRWQVTALDSGGSLEAISSWVELRRPSAGSTDQP